MADNKSLPLVHVNDLIVLTEKERLIFDLLLKVERHYGLETEIRVADGWVRDKLLGIDSNDIDIALHKLSGWDFCVKMNKYLRSIEEKTAELHVIRSNEEKSKNLEITRMQLDGTWKNQNADSENQNAIRFGSPEKDAYLRDLTINSNPDKSKHLETAKMKLYGICIDFGHLRSEVYDVKSRIPRAKFASPRDDAFRRDLTINSLFYNINNDSIEDFTG